MDNEISSCSSANQAILEKSFYASPLLDTKKDYCGMTVDFCLAAFKVGSRAKNL